MLPPDDDRVEPALGEGGHYSYQEVCQAAYVCAVKDAGFRVNVVALDSDGTARSHLDVPVRQPTPDDGGQSFHLWHNCPWGR
jgi:hypothetical protein